MDNSSHDPLEGPWKGMEGSYGEMTLEQKQGLLRMQTITSVWEAPCTLGCLCSENIVFSHGEV